MNAAQRAVASLPRRLGLGGQPIALYLGASLVSFWFLIALFDAHNLREFLQSPNWAHPLGTDNFGRDVLSRVIHGTRVDLEMGIMGVVWPFLK